MPNLNNLTVQDLQWGTANWSGQGYIDGLKMVWNSATSISVTSGAAFIPSMSKCLPSPTTLTLSGLSLTASTWYHVYLYGSVGAPAIECVTTAPSAPYNGTARTKTGDTSRRYVGSVKTDVSGNIYNFQQDGVRISYQENLGNSPFYTAPLTATTATNFDVSGIVPVTSKLVNIRVTADTSVGGRITNSNTAAPYIVPVAIGSTAVQDFPTNASQVFQYFNNGTPTSGIAIAVFGYTYER